MNREVGSYGEDNAETARFEGDDVGLPESPIYSNFSKLNPELFPATPDCSPASHQPLPLRHQR